MQKISLYIDDKKLAQLRKQSERSGVPVAEIIRRAVNEALKKLA